MPPLLAQMVRDWIVSNREVWRMENIDLGLNPRRLTYKNHWLEVGPNPSFLTRVRKPCILRERAYDVHAESKGSILAARWDHAPDSKYLGCNFFRCCQITSCRMGYNNFEAFNDVKFVVKSPTTQCVLCPSSKLKKSTCAKCHPKGDPGKNDVNRLKLMGQNLLALNKCFATGH